VQDDPVKIAGKPKAVPAKAVTIRWVEAASSDAAAPGRRRVCYRRE